MKALVPLGVLVAVVAAGVAGLSAHGANARAAAGATIDRTLACDVLPAGVGAIQVSAYPKLGSAFPSPAQATVSTGNGGGLAGGFTTLVTVSAGGVPHAAPGLSINTKLCHGAKASVALARRGLAGGPAPVGSRATCLAARQVFVHLHAVLAAKPTWTSNAGLQVAHGKLLSAEIAVSNPKHRPLVDMSIKGQKTSFYSAKTCF